MNRDEKKKETKQSKAKKKNARKMQRWYQRRIIFFHSPSNEGKGRQQGRRAQETREQEYIEQWV